MLRHRDLRGRRALLSLTVTALLAALALPGSPAAQATTSQTAGPVRTADPHPTITARASTHAAHGTKLLPRPMRARTALARLDAAGKHAAALANHTTVAHLGALASGDETVWLSATGHVFFADTATATQASTAAVVAAAPGWALHPNSEAFQLHSRAGSKHTLYLDFDGYTLPSGTGWTPGINPAAYGGFSTDGTASFTDDERTYIQTVWRMVAEKYAPFDIDVTTEAPPAGGLDNTGNGDLTWGTRVVISSDMTARGTVCPASSSGGCLGIAFIDVFNALEQSPGFYEPAWVWTKFTAATGTLSAGQVANAAAHEAGHTLGLDHDATNADPSYYAGSGNWFPIMGSGILAVGQFSKGDYPDALTADGQSNKDDLAVIAADGAPLRTDDYGNTTATASALAPGATASGIISTRTDVDVFKVITSCPGDLTAAATGIGDGQAVDLKVSILDAGGSALVSDDPTSDQDTGSPWPYSPTGLDASATQPGAASGTYYVVLDGVGKGTFATGGYDDYGSLGQYQLAVSGCTSGGGSTAPGQPATVSTVPDVHATTGTISWTAPSDDGGSPVTGYTITGLPSAGGTATVGAATLSYPVSGLTPGVSYDLAVAAINAVGTGVAKHAALRVATWAPPLGPTVSIKTYPTQASVTWTAPTNPGHATPAGWHVVLRDGHGNTLDPPYDTSDPSVPGVDIIGLTPGSYSVVVSQKVTSDAGSSSGPTTKSFSIAAPAPKVPTAPKIGTPSSGVAGGTVTATARWAAPTSNGGSTITGYRVIAYKSTISGSVISATISKLLSAGTRGYVFALPAARYKFRVVAYNAVGRSPYSAYSTLVYAK